ncbi:hypothetical protein FRC18_003342 [Serendipita sp. 400]|nr:hypothetical protein FRC18_003342 [Serendipita sp. 400]
MEGEPGAKQDRRHTTSNDVGQRSVFVCYCRGVDQLLSLDDPQYKARKCEEENHLDGSAIPSGADLYAPQDWAIRRWLGQLKERILHFEPAILINRIQLGSQ